MRVRKIRKLGAIYLFFTAFLVMAFLPELTGIRESTKVESKEIKANPVTVVSAIKQGIETKPKYTHWKVKKKKCACPEKLYRGVGFVVEGEIFSSRHILYASGVIEDEDGKILFEDRAKAKEKTAVDLSVMDDKLFFSKLDEGDYRYLVCLYDEKGNCNNVIDKKFQVIKREWAWPVYGGIKGDDWCCKCSTHNGRHYGVDIKGPGKEIHAAADGTVAYAKYHNPESSGSFGKLLILYHGGGIYSYYAHCAEHRVKAGDKVKRGDVIAVVGETGRAFGPHLHFEMRKGPVFEKEYNSNKLIDKYTYIQFNPLKKGYIKAGSY